KNKKNPDQYLRVITLLDRDKILYNLHSSPLSRHFGIKKTIAKAMELYYWPIMGKNIKNYIETCDVCQRSVDFVGPLAITSQGNPKETSKFLYENIICQHGVPTIIQSDRGSSFLNHTISLLKEEIRSKPSNSNNKNENSWASNIKQEEKPVDKGKQKAIPLTSKVNKAKSDKTCVDINTENNKQADTEHVHITHDKMDTQDNTNNMITKQEGPSTKVLESNNLKKDNSIDIINDQEATSEKNPSNTSTPNQNILLMEVNCKNTDDQTPVANLDQNITMEPSDCNKENRTDEKEFTLVTSKKNN
ncbi:8746_t:CDS:2, partial [Cetraspora pellucida]